MKKIAQIIRKIIRNIKRNKSYQYRLRYIGIISILIFLILFSIISFRKTLGLYESNTKISPNITTAVYVFEPGEIIKNMGIKDLVPSDAPYVYSFTVANYNDQKESDVDLTYSVELVATTNLPLEYRVYYNEDYQSGTDIISSNELKKDVDGTWYHQIKTRDNFSFQQNKKTQDTFTIAVIYPSNFSNDSSYTEQIENIDIIIKSKQTIEGES